MRLSPGPGQLERIIELARRTPEVSECHRISGEDRFLVHGRTTSSFIVSTPVPPRPVLS